MKQYTISTLHRTLASVLLFSQLLTSCGGAEMIAPVSTPSPTHQNMGVSDDSPISTPRIDPPTPLAVPDSKGYDSDDSSQSFTPPTYTTRRGHHIALIQEGDKYVARVQEQLPPGFKSATQILPVHFQRGLFPEDLTPFSYVDVDKANGHVFCAKHGGLLGGMFRDKNGRPFGSDPSVWDLHNHRCNKDTRQSVSSSSTPWKPSITFTDKPTYTPPTSTPAPAAIDPKYDVINRYASESADRLKANMLAQVREHFAREKAQKAANEPTKDPKEEKQEEQDEKKEPQFSLKFLSPRQPSASASSSQPASSGSGAQHPFTSQPESKKEPEKPRTTEPQESQKQYEPLPADAEEIIQNVGSGGPADTTFVAAFAQKAKRPICLYDKNGKLIFKYGKEHKAVPMDIQFIKNPDGNSYWQLVCSDEVVSSRANNGLLDVLLAQLSQEERKDLNIHTADNLRKATADVIREDPVLREKIINAVERFKRINQGESSLNPNKTAHQPSTSASSQPASSSNSTQNSTNKQVDDLSTGIEKFLGSTDDLDTPSGKQKAQGFLKDVKKLEEDILKDIKKKEDAVNTATQIGSPRSKQAGNIKEPVTATEKEITEHQEQLERLEELKESLLLNTNLTREDLKACGIVRDTSKGLFQSMDIDGSLLDTSKKLSTDELKEAVDAYQTKCKSDATYQQLLDDLALSITKSEAVPSSILLAADREIKEQALREHPLYQEGIGLALQAAHHRNGLEEQAKAKGIHSVKAHGGNSHAVEKEKLQQEADRVKEEVLNPLREVFEAPSTPRGTEKAKAFFSGMGESVKDTLELPLVLGKFGITAAASLATWEDKLGLKSVYEGVKDLFSEAKQSWEDDAAYQARQQAAREYKAKAQAYEKAFNAAHYHADQAKTAGYISAEALQFVFGSEVFKAGAQGVKTAGRACIPKNIHIGKQGKHIIGHNNYLVGRSILTANPQDLIQKFHKGKFKKLRTRYNKITVDFEDTIGIYYENEKEIGATRFGTIHLQKDGIHIVPANPNQS